MSSVADAFVCPLQASLWFTVLALAAAVCGEPQFNNRFNNQVNNNRFNQVQQNRFNNNRFNNNVNNNNVRRPVPVNNVRRPVPVNNVRRPAPVNNVRRPAAAFSNANANANFVATPANARDGLGNEVYPGCNGTVCLPEATLCAGRKNKGKTRSALRVKQVLILFLPMPCSWPLCVQPQVLLVLRRLRRDDPPQRPLELVHRPQLLPQDVHGHGLLREPGRAGLCRGPDGAHQRAQPPPRRQAVRRRGRGVQPDALPAAQHQRVVLGLHPQDDAAYQPPEGQRGKLMIRVHGVKSDFL